MSAKVRCLPVDFLGHRMRDFQREGLHKMRDFPKECLRMIIAVLEECYRDLAGPVLARGAVLRLPISAGLLVQLGVRHLALPVVVIDSRR